MTHRVPLCIYHFPCLDGFTAAWAVWKYFGEGEVEFFKGDYQKGPPPKDVVANRDVFIVDFCYPIDVLRELSEYAKSILVLDHHDTAQKELKDVLPYSRDPDVQTWRDENENKLTKIFDMNRSGAGITWDFFHSNSVHRPHLINVVEARDLWKLDKFKGIREYHSYMTAFEWTFDNWNVLHNTFTYAQENVDEDVSIMRIGKMIDRVHLKETKELTDRTARPMKIGGRVVSVANLPYTMCSDGANYLAAQGNDFGASYYDGADGRVFSLRSHNNEQGPIVHVGELAKEMGIKLGTKGGGHPNAAGFTAPLGWEGE